jgi:hypothetical protein
MEGRTIYDSPIADRIEMQTVSVEDALMASMSYYQDNQALPSSIDDLIEPKQYLRSPESWWDGFAPLRSYIIVRRLQPLHFLLFGRHLIIYSFGPDGRDDHGAIRYDPTNGLVSKGDIIGSIELP